MRNASLFYLPIHGDERGSLIALESCAGVIPFDVERVYYIFDTRPDVRRGLHAHRDLKQMLICVSGRVTVRVNDGHDEQDYLLDDPAKGLLLESMTWREMFDFSPGAVLLVLASKPYDPSDYIRSFDEFVQTVEEDEA